MTSIEEVLTQAAELRVGISRLLCNSTYRQHGDLSTLKANRQDSDQIFLLDELQGIMEKLSEAEEAICYIKWPVDEISHLHKNSSGQYETAQGRVFQCGHEIEAYVSDGWHDAPYWTRTRVEHDGSDYYLVGHRDVSLDGLVIRTRRT